MSNVYEQRSLFNNCVDEMVLHDYSRGSIKQPPKQKRWQQQEKSMPREEEETVITRTSSSSESAYNSSYNSSYNNNNNNNNGVEEQDDHHDDDSVVSDCGSDGTEEDMPFLVGSCHGAALSTPPELADADCDSEAGEDFFSVGSEEDEASTAASTVVSVPALPQQQEEEESAAADQHQRRPRRGRRPKLQSPPPPPPDSPPPIHAMSDFFASLQEQHGSSRIELAATDTLQEGSIRHGRSLHSRSTNILAEDGHYAPTTPPSLMVDTSFGSTINSSRRRRAVPARSHTSDGRIGSSNTGIMTRVSPKHLSVEEAAKEAGISVMKKSADSDRLDASSAAHNDGATTRVLKKTKSESAKAASPKKKNGLVKSTSPDHSSNPNNNNNSTIAKAKSRNVPSRSQTIGTFTSAPASLSPTTVAPKRQASNKGVSSTNIAPKRQASIKGVSPTNIALKRQASNSAVSPTNIAPMRQASNKSKVGKSSPGDIPRRTSITKEQQQQQQPGSQNTIHRSLRKKDGDESNKTKSIRENRTVDEVESNKSKSLRKNRSMDEDESNQRKSLRKSRTMDGSAKKEKKSSSSLRPEDFPRSLSVDKTITAVKKNQRSKSVSRRQRRSTVTAVDRSKTPSFRRTRTASTTMDRSKTPSNRRVRSTEAVGGSTPSPSMLEYMFKRSSTTSSSSQRRQRTSDEQSVGTTQTAGLFSRNKRSRSKRTSTSSHVRSGEHNNPRALNIFGSDLMSEDFILSRLDDLEANPEIVLLELEDCLIAKRSDEIPLRLRDVLLQVARPWEGIHFVDELLDGFDYKEFRLRRKQFMKGLGGVCAQQVIPLQFKVKIHLNDEDAILQRGTKQEDHSNSAMTSLVQEFGRDVSVTTLHLKTRRATLELMQALIGLVMRDKREWDMISLTLTCDGLPAIPNQTKRDSKIQAAKQKLRKLAQSRDIELMIN